MRRFLGDPTQDHLAIKGRPRIKTLRKTFFVLFLPPRPPPRVFQKMNWVSVYLPGAYSQVSQIGLSLKTFLIPHVIIDSSVKEVRLAQELHWIKMSLYFKKETAGWQNPGWEAALVSLAKGSLRARGEQLGRQPWRGEEKETHDHKELIMKNGKWQRAKNNKQ